MFFGRKKSLLGLDVGSSSVKAVEITRVGQGLVVSGMGKAEIESPKPWATRSTRRYAKAGLSPSCCVSAVSGRSVIHRQVPMMAIPDAELKQAMEYEADKYIPFDVTEVQLDAQRLRESETDEAQPAGGQGQMKVLLVAAKKTFDRRTHQLAAVGGALTPRWLTLTSWRWAMRLNCAT